MSGRPQVLLVHGAWHGSWAWDALLPHLEGAGLDATALDLPSSGSGGDLAADAAAVRTALLDRPGPTVVVGHSYGGIAVSEGAAGIADVTHLVYVCAFMLDAGESLLGALAGVVPPWITVDEAHGSSTVGDPVPVFFGDVEPDLAGRLAARLAPQSLASFAAPQTAAAWRGIPSTYVVCSQDQAIPPAAQRAMAARADTVRTLDSSHSPFLSRPKELAEIITAAADA